MLFGLVFSILLGLVALPAGHAAGLQKCQDEDGMWHYGNHAAEECAKSSEITKLNSKGAEVGKIAPPPTKEELEERNKKKQQAAAAKKNKEQQRKQDRSLVEIWGSEEVITSTRDRKLESIDNNLDITRQLRQGVMDDIEKLKARKQTDKVKKLITEREVAINSYDQVIENSMSERQKLQEQYSDILENFRQASVRLSGN